MLWAGGTLPDSAKCISEGAPTSGYSGGSPPDTSNVLIVWVGFEDSTSCIQYTYGDGTLLPSWFRRMETEFEEYYDWQSYGKHYVDAKTVRSEAEPGTARSDAVLVGAQNPVDGPYVFKVREDGYSTTVLDRAEVVVIDHDPNVSVAVDRTGTVLGYRAERAVWSTTLPDGSSGDIVRSGDPVHAEPGAVMVVEWQEVASEDALIVVHKGLAGDDVPTSPAVSVEREIVEGTWSPAGVLPRRAWFAEECIRVSDIGHTGGRLALRLRWLDYHSIDRVAVVRPAAAADFVARSLVPDTLEVAYEVVDPAVLAAADGQTATIGHAEKLTFGVTASAPADGWVQSVAVAFEGYYSEAAGERLPEQDPVSAIAYVSGGRPNPFNPNTKIEFGLVRGGQARLDLYSVDGRLVRRLVDDPLPGGEHSLVWDGKDGSGIQQESGVYFYRFSFDGETRSGKLILTK